MSVDIAAPKYLRPMIVAYCDSHMTAGMVFNKHSGKKRIRRYNEYRNSSAL